MKGNNIPIWRQELTSAQKKEGKSSFNRWIQLATVDANNEPRLRTVVFRGWHTNSSMIIYTDKRSEKIEHIQSNCKAEILWLFFKSKSQFRFKGSLIELKENTNYWNKLSEESKSTWFWQHPGKRINAEFKFKQIASSDLNTKPENFIVLKLEICSVEMLKLLKPMHKRYRWNKDDGWRRYEINP